MTTYTDKNLTCVECKTTFVFSARDQEFHASKGFSNEPKRCPSCRAARRVQRGESVPAGAGARSGSPTYAGPRAQGGSGRGHVNNRSGRPRGRRDDYDRGGRGDGDGSVAARSFDGGGASGSYTANCMACGTETDAPANGSSVVFCPSCVEKMSAIARS
ncbi:MAG TPA: zinc-ribbon domain-containing protein [Dehalococcoidia bacterium]|nr:zinc-ribbon domain-containing protein [Dehalococcoidia bacterium]